LKDELKIIKENLSKIWKNNNLSSLASTGAKARLHSAGEWSPPENVVPKKELIYLNVGIPDSFSLPKETIGEAMRKVLDRKDDASLRYGFGPGYYPIRKYLAERYSRERGVEVTEEWFCLTNGSSGAIDLVARSLINPGDVIITESPTYMGTLGNFRGVGAEIHSVSMDGEGLDIHELGDKIQALKKEGKRIKLVYTISAFHNPTGVTMTEGRRNDLLKLAAVEGFVILDDVAYGDLYFDQPPPSALSGLSEGYGVVTVGTFSKILATGLRIGCVHARPELINFFGRMRFDMGQNQMALRMMGQVLEEGNLEEHALRVRSIYKEKMDIISGALEHTAGNYLNFERPSGGFYLWVNLLDGLKAEDVWRTATQEGVAVNPGDRFLFDKRKRSGEHLRVVYSWAPRDRLEEAARRIAVACERVAAGDTA